MNNGRFFDAQTRDKLAYGLFLEQQHNDEPLFSTALHVDIVFYMPIPVSVRQRSQYHSKTPDLDNLEKFLLDCMTGRIITDDRIICSKTAKKVYDKDPRTEFTITEVV